CSTLLAVRCTMRPLTLASDPMTITTRPSTRIDPSKLMGKSSYAQDFPAALELDQSLANRVQHCLRAVVDLQLGVHVADMVSHRLLADLQAARHLLVGLADGQEFEDLDLARRQTVVELFGGGRAGQHVEDAVGHRAR